MIGTALRKASPCGGSELPQAIHPRCSAKNTPSATAGSQRAREKPVQETATRGKWGHSTFSRHWSAMIRMTAKTILIVLTEEGRFADGVRAWCVTKTKGGESCSVSDQYRVRASCSWLPNVICLSPLPSVPPQTPGDITPYSRLGTSAKGKGR